MRRRKPGECVCPCHNSGMTGALGPCGWCADLHRVSTHYYGDTCLGGHGELADIEAAEERQFDGGDNDA